MHEGQFQGHLQADCTTEFKPNGQLPNLMQRLKEHIQNTRTVHTENFIESENRWRLHTTNFVNDDSKAIEIKEDINLKHSPNNFKYDSRSLGVKASGLAGYLKYVQFSAEITLKNNESYDVHVENAVKIERPWYALSPVFYLITKGVTKSKFETARNEIWSIIEKLLSNSNSP